VEIASHYAILDILVIQKPEAARFVVKIVFIVQIQHNVKYVKKDLL